MTRTNSRRQGPPPGVRLMAAFWLVIVIAAGPFRPADAVAESAPVGEVAAQQGVATVYRDGNPHSLRPGAPVYAHDMIVTATDAKVRITLEDSSSLTIGGSSQVHVASFLVGSQGVREEGLFDLVVGIVRAVVGPADPAARFDIRSRVAVASARSTEYLVEVTPGHAAVFVVEGAVAVAGQTGPEVTLGPGEGTDVDVGQPAGPVKTWGEGRRQAVLERTTLP